MTQQGVDLRVTVLVRKVFREGVMKYSEFRRWLKKQGCTFETHEGGSGHITVVNPKSGKRTQLPAHGAGKDLKTGLVEGIKKQLGLK